MGPDGLFIFKSIFTKTLVLIKFKKYQEVLSPPPPSPLPPSFKQFKIGPIYGKDATIFALIFIK